jgi:FkbH-like protein
VTPQDTEAARGGGGVLSVEVEDMERMLDGAGAATGDALLQLARAHADTGDVHEAFRALRRIAGIDRSFTTWSAGARLRRGLRERDAPAGAQLVRVGLVGTSTIDQLADLLGLAGLNADLDLDIEAAGYGQYETTLMDPDAPLYAAGCDVIVLAPDARSVRLPAFTDDPDAAINEELGRWTSVWSAIRASCHAQIFQLNFVPPFERTGGSLESTLQGSRRRMFRALNDRLAEAARDSMVQIVDAEAVGAAYGLEQWWDDRYWFHAKQAVSLGALPSLATEIAAVLRARVGRTRKCLVIDLDNTVWGGVVGDDGVEQLVLDGSAAGEAYLALQDQLLDLRRAGVLLAVCSKNEDVWARAPFLERDDMRLGLDDFAAFVANWEPKTKNLETIATQLDLGLDSLVFLDDNPAERALVRDLMPEVDVIELPDDPSRFPRALAQYRGFEPATRTAEDGSRTEHYRGRAAAFELQQRSHTVEEFLTNLSMVAEIRPFDAMTLDRVAQLVNKTNQWNLTTRRHPVEVLERWADDPDAVTMSLRLHDRYTDHGIVAVAIAFESDRALDVDTFLMSCRVIGRTVEQTMLQHLVGAARDRHLDIVRGVYVPTARNAVVRDLYGRLGFTLLEDDGHQSRWELAVGDIDPAAAATAATTNPFIEVRDPR